MWRLTLLTGLLAAATIAVAVAMHDTERLFELAQNAYRTRAALSAHCPLWTHGIRAGATKQFAAGGWRQSA